MIPVLREGDIDACSKTLAFARKPTMTDQEIKSKRAEAKQKKLEKTAAQQGFNLTKGNSRESHPTAQVVTPDADDNLPQPKKPQAGHRNSSRNGTRDEDCSEADAEIITGENRNKYALTGKTGEDSTKSKRCRGRQPCSRNKKELG